MREEIAQEYESSSMTWSRATAGRRSLQRISGSLIVWGG